LQTFRTIFPPLRSSVSISHDDRLLCLGSCFAEQMGGRLQRLKFPTSVNPFGIVFNPVSMANSLERLLVGEPFCEAELVENQGLWHSFEHHGCFSNPDKTAALDAINRSFSEGRKFLENTNRLIVTLGSAHVFTLKKTGAVVANCHKLPAADFERRRLTVDEVLAALLPIFQKLKSKLPELEIIATVSPVRHLRDGLMENQRSKATLLLALDELAQKLTYVHYFPAYEILLDDLRDYRFYAEDMAHPSPQATDYIWQYFEQAFFEEKTKQLVKRIEQVLTALSHRPFHAQSVEHQAFLRKQAEFIHQILKEFPGLDFGQELANLGVG